MAQAALPYIIQAVVAYAVGVVVNELSSPQKIEGPSLNDLRAQSSSYGKFLPLLYGTNRVAGTMIWLENNQLKETATVNKQGGKGGGPKSETTTYSYSATFAVALAGVEISKITRIWCNSVLIYDATSVDAATLWANSELMSSVDIFKGTNTQAVSGRIQANKPDTPAYRGVPYIVINDLQLEKFGNVIPNVTCEVVAETQSTNYKARIGSYTIPGVSFSGQYPTVLNDGVLRSRVYVNTGVANLFDLRGNYLGGTEAYLSQSGIDDTAPGLDSFNDEYQGLIGGHRVQIKAINNPAVIEYLVDNTGTKFDMLASAGIVGSLFMLAFSADNQHVLCMLGDPSDPVLLLNGHTSQPKFWYLLTVQNNQSVIVSQGTVSGLPTNTGRLGYSKSAALDRYNGYHACVLESDLKHIWQAYGAGAGQVQLYEIDEQNVLREIGNPFAKLPYFSFTKPGVYADNGILITLAGGASGAGTIGYFSREQDGTAKTTGLGAIVTDLCGRAGIASGDINVTQLADNVEGYAVTNLSALKSNLEPLQAAFRFDVVESEYKLKFLKRGASSIVTLTQNDLGAYEYGQAAPQKLTQERGKEVGLPRRVNVSYVSSARDYDPGQQYSERLVTQSEHVADIKLPIVMSDSYAAQLAEIVLYVAWDGRNTFEFSLPYKYVKLEPSDVVTINYEDETHRVRITEVSAGQPGIIECRAELDTADSYVSTAIGQGGASASSTIALAGPTNLALLDIPLLRDQDDDSGFYVAAGGYYPGWRGAVLMKSSDGGEVYNQARALLTEATMGSTTNTLATGEHTVIDRVNSVNVRVNNGGQLESVTELAMLNGANAAAIGQPGRWEIIKFQTATLQANGTYTLTDLIRGYKGTEHNKGNHATSDVFVLLTEAALSRTTANDNEIGLQRHYKGVTTGSTIFTALEYALTNRAESLKPYSPVNITATRDGSNNIAIKWIRRTRIGGEWRDGVNAQLGEATQAYEIDVMSGSTVKRTITGLATPAYTYTAANQITDFGSVQSSVTVRIYQLSATVGRGNKGEATV